MNSPHENWTPRPKLTTRFWVGCADMLLAISFLIATTLIYSRTQSMSFPWDQTIFALLMLALGARFALSKGNLAALKARLS